MRSLKSHEIESLVREAMEARDQAYAPHSHFYVGAALLVEDGTLYRGCNVENASYGLTLCAERTAAAAAVAAGHRSWRAVAIASVGGVTPCGACRQFLAEFGTDVPILCVDTVSGKRTQFHLGKLLPDVFAFEEL
ncbi:MAG: cytidine deaminase [Planctomycetota bacterium]